MSSSVGRVLTNPSNLFRQLCISFLLITFRSVEGYLTAKPQDAIRFIGQSVTFSCNSTWTDRIRWWFIRDDGADENIEELGANAVVHLTLSDVKIVGEPGEGIPDGYRSSLIIDEVTRWHTGTFRCQDGTGSRGSARLTVTSTPVTTCLTVSPRDQVVVAGDSVVLTASSNSTRLRYYYEGLTEFVQSGRIELYNGEELNDCNVDERYSVIGVGDMGHADLVIRSVQAKDAGRYIVKDMRKRAFEVAANLVVFERFPECQQIWHQTEDDEIDLQCNAKYTGKLTPRVLFLRNDVTAQSLQKTGNGGIIHFMRRFSISDLTRDDIANSRTFQIGFELSQCGEQAAVWSWKHTISNYIELPAYSTRQQYLKSGNVIIVMMIIIAALGVLLIVSVVINIALIVQRRRRDCHAGNSKEETAGGGYGRLRNTSTSSSSSSSTSSTSSVLPCRSLCVSGVAEAEESHDKTKDSLVAVQA